MSETEDIPDLGVDEGHDAAEQAFERGAEQREELNSRQRNQVARAARDRREALDALQAERAAREELAREVAELRKGAVTQEVERLGADLDRAEAEHAAALADGDPERIAKASGKVARLAAKAEAAEIMAKQAPEPEAPRQRQPQVASEVQDWWDRNPWFKRGGQQDAKTKLAILADTEAREVEGLAVNSPEYFDFIERKVEGRFPGTIQRDDAGEEDPQPAPKRTATGPAPVTRGATPGRPATSQQRIRATPEQVQMAEELGIPLEKYMAQVVRIGQAGGFKDERFMGVTRR